MSSFHPRWDYCWKCEFDWYRCQSNRLYHHDGEQLGFVRNAHIKTQSKKLYITRKEGYQFTAFDKTCTQEIVKCHIQHKDNWLRWIVIEQVNYKQYYFAPKEIALAHFQTPFGRRIRDAFWENEGKIHETRCVKEFFT